jgi:hypothetical protein
MTRSAPHGLAKLTATDALALLDWKRTIVELYAHIRASTDPETAWRRWRDVRERLFRAHPQSPLSGRVGPSSAGAATSTTTRPRGCWQTYHPCRPSIALRRAAENLVSGVDRWRILGGRPGRRSHPHPSLACLRARTQTGTQRVPPLRPQLRMDKQFGRSRRCRNSSSTSSIVGEDNELALKSVNLMRPAGPQPRGRRPFRGRRPLSAPA